MIPYRGLYSIILLGLLFIFSCNKEKPDTLEGEKSIFVGTWNWDYTVHHHNWCDAFPSKIDTLTPSSENHTFKIQFLEEGKVIYWQDGIKINEYDLFFTLFDGDQSCFLNDATQYAIKYSFESEENDFGGCVSQDSLRTGFFKDFLFPFTPGCENYTNFFVRE